MPRHLHKNWHSIKMCVMKDILHAKAHYCTKFKEELLNSGKNWLVEAIMGDIFWSSGLPPQVAETTKPAFYPGTNQLGHLLESVRFDIMKKAILCDLLLVVSLHQSDPLSDTFFCDIVVNHEIIKRACLSQQRALEEMLHRLVSFFTITRGVILICIFPLS